MQLLPGGELKDIGTYKPPHQSDDKMSLFLDPLPQPSLAIDMDSWKHKVLNVTSIKVRKTRLSQETIKTSEYKLQKTFVSQIQARRRF